LSAATFGNGADTRPHRACDASIVSIPVAGRASARQDEPPGGSPVPHSLSDELVELIAERFHALAEPTRIKVLDRLRDGEATVLDLTAAIGTTQQNISKHLRLLQHAGIVARRKDGNYAHYRIADESVYTLCEAVCGSLRNRIATLGRITSSSR
jgi:ArsR family transcriptional regulator